MRKFIRSAASLFPIMFLCACSLSRKPISYSGFRSQKMIALQELNAGNGGMPCDPASRIYALPAHAAVQRKKAIIHAEIKSGKSKALALIQRAPAASLHSFQKSIDQYKPELLTATQAHKSLKMFATSTIRQHTSNPIFLIIFIISAALAFICLILIILGDSSFYWPLYIGGLFLDGLFLFALLAGISLIIWLILMFV